MNLSVVETADAIRLVESSEPDKTAFERLYRSFHPRLVRLLRRRTGDPALAEDLAQETLLRAYIHLESFDPARPQWPWLKTIATRLAIDHARCNGREILRESESHGHADDLNHEEDGVLRVAMENLTRSQRIALSLRYLDDWKSSEAAIFLGINRVAFEQLLVRARRRLRAEYVRLSEKALGIILLPYRKMRRLLSRFAHHVRETVSTLGPTGGIGVDAAAQLTSSVLAVITAAAVVGSSLPTMSEEFAREAPARSTSDRALSPGRGGPAGPGGSGAGEAADASGGAASSNSETDPETIAKKLTNPTDGVREPEDAPITSIAFGPGSGNDQTIYAAGRVPCASPCDRVLFRSSDGGASWSRLEARGFLGDSLIIPSGGDGRTIFAMGPAGLQVSRDAGAHFELAAVVGAPFTVGSAAVSPAFFQGDPSVLIGAQTLTRYRDDTRTVEPYLAVMTGPLNPVYSPGYPADPRIFVGGVRVHPESNEALAVIHTCIDAVCKELTLEGAYFTPKVRLADNFSQTELVLAFTATKLFLSRDGAQSFATVPIPTGAATVQDVAYTNTGVLFAATTTTPIGMGGGLLQSYDGGASWESSNTTLFDKGTAVIATDSNRFLVALADKGLACSSDGGVTWARRCS